MPAVIVLEAIFEADLTDEQYAYRRSAHDAIRKVHQFLNRGYTDVVDVDLKGYFDTIPHHELMKSVALRVSDAAMLTLVKTWLEMAVEETDKRGNKRRTTVNKDRGRGTPQGAPIGAPCGVPRFWRRARIAPPFASPSIAFHHRHLQPLLEKPHQGYQFKARV
jgi:RNA-directed DNA polymerase